MSSVIRSIRYIVAQFFIQIAGIMAFSVGGAAWARFDSLWAGALGLIVVAVISMPIYGLLEGPDKESTGE